MDAAGAMAFWSILMVAGAAVLILAAMALSMMATVALSVRMVMMAALSIRVIIQLTRKESCHGIIGLSADARIQLNSCLRKGHPRTGADTATDQHIHLQSSKEACQRTVAAASGIHHFLMDDLSLFHVINLHLTGMTKVLKYISFFIS